MLPHRSGSGSLIGLHGEHSLDIWTNQTLPKWSHASRGTSRRLAPNSPRCEAGGDGMDEVGVDEITINLSEIKQQPYSLSMIISTGWGTVMG